MPIEDCRVLFFPNEKVTQEWIEVGVYHDRITEFGFRRDNISIFNYYAPDIFFDKKYDVLYISGGNTFGTMKRIRETGADILIRERVE